MKLRYAPNSPFVRKVMVAAIETGLAERIEIVPTDTDDPASDLARDNPLGRVPALVRDDGSVLIESDLICAWLDGEHRGPRLVPEDPAARTAALQLQAYADGLTEAAIQIQRERARPERLQWDRWIERQRVKMGRTLDFLEREAGRLAPPVAIGHIALGCALGWIDLRVADAEWRKGRPRLAAWYEGFSKRPSMAATAPSAAGKAA
jgi:glutathione S-transferase